MTHQNEAAETGRRSLLEDPEVRESICMSLLAGNTIQDSVLAAGVSESSYYSWLQRGREEQARIGKGEKPRKKWAVYLEFLEATSRAVFEGKQRLVTVISNAALDDWHAAAWLLERKFPREYAQKVNHTIESELRAALEKLKRGLPKDEYQRALRCIAGQPGAAGAGSGGAGRPGSADDVRPENEP